MGAICALTSIPDVPIYEPQFAIAPLVLGALIAGGAALVGSVASGYFNAKSVSDTNRTNRDIANQTNATNISLFNRQQDYNTQMYNDQKAYNNELIKLMNDYNDPVQQRQRFENAGINPFMALGNMDAGNMQSVSTPSAPSSPSAPNLVTPTLQAQNFDTFGNIGRDIGNVVNGYFQNANLAARTEQTLIDNITRLDENYARLQLMQSNKDLTDVQREEARERINDIKTFRQSLVEQLNLTNENLRGSNDLQQYQKASSILWPVHQE